MNTDSEFRRFRFVETRPGEGFGDIIDGWIARAEQIAPGKPKAILEEFGVAELPGGTVLREVSFKVEHAAVAAALTEWARESGRSVGRVAGEEFVLGDGRRFPLGSMRFGDSRR